ncbi:type II secretion system F family protein [Nocardioides montaniterrae]
MGAAVAGLAVAAGVALLLPVGPSLEGERRQVPRLLVLAPLLLVPLADGSLAALAVIAGVAAVAVARLLRRQAVVRQAREARTRVIEVCEALQVELGAGQSPVDALALAVHDWPAIEPAARTARSGGDVPPVLRELAALPGAQDLRIVAAAWQVAHRTGHGLADAVGRVAADLRAAEQTRRVVAGELASARATSRLVAVLPVAALVLGSGAGANPWAFLLGTPGGWACLAGGLACGIAGLAWIEALAADVERDR